MMSIEEKRRGLFEAWADDQGYDLTRNNIVAYEAGATRCAWAGFNAALDAVVIELPDEAYVDDFDIGGAFMKPSAVVEAIESTGLGLKVRP